MKYWSSILVLLLASCVNDIISIADKASRTSEAEWSSQIAVPLAFGELGMKDLIEEKGDLVEHHIGPDGLITLIYESTLFSLRAEDVYTLPNQTFSELVVLNAAQLSVLNTTGSLNFTVARDVGMSLPGMELDSIIYKAGSWDLDVISTLEHDVQLNVQLLHSDQGGQIIEHDVDASYSGTLPVNVSASKDLTGARGDLTQGAQGHSELQLLFTIDITKQAGNPIKPVESIRFDMGVNDQAYRYMKGRLYNANLSNDMDSIKISLFNNTNSGSFNLADPRVKLYFTNSFGINVDASLTRFDGTNEDGGTVALNGVPVPVQIPASPALGQTSVDSVILTQSNSNIDDYLNNRPKYNAYDYSISTTNATNTVWVSDSSVLQCDARVEIPLHGSARDYVLETLVGIEELSDITSDATLDELLFRVYTRNGFPLDVRVQIFFEDSLSQEVKDSLFVIDDLVLPAAPVNADGLVVQELDKITDALFTRDRLDSLGTVNRLRLRAEFNSLFEGTEQPEVKILDDYLLYIQFGIQATIKVDEQ